MYRKNISSDINKSQDTKAGSCVEYTQGNLSKLHKWWNPAYLLRSQNPDTFDGVLLEVKGKKRMGIKKSAFMKITAAAFEMGCACFRDKSLTCQKQEE